MKLSVIVPYVNEWPQISFTIRSIAEELLDRVDFEIIAVDNWCRTTELQQNRIPDRGHAHYVDKDKNVYGVYSHVPTNAERVMSHIESMANKHSWLKYVRYDEKLSHWNAKRVAIQEAAGDIYLFLDSHVVPSRDSIYTMFKYYENTFQTLKGSIHLPLAYHILESQRLIYKPVYEVDKGFLTYQFTNLITKKDIFETPCMSTCGMMIHKYFYSLTGGWPEELGIYGGGENFMNYVMPVVGLYKYIWNRGTLYHHGERRGYNYEGEDFIRNRLLAMYLVGGRSMAQRFCSYQQINPMYMERMLSKLLRLPSIQKQEDLIEMNRVNTIEEWIESWRGREVQ